MPKLKRIGYAILKLAHLLFTSLWIGGAFCLILLLTLGLGGDATHPVVVAIQIVDLAVVVPAAAGSLLTGILFSSVTHWGYFKHRWIMAKYLINLIPILLGAFIQAPWLEHMLALARAYNLPGGLPAEFFHYRDWFLAFTVGQWALLLVAVYLSIFKPTLRARSAPPVRQAPAV
ncbi:MAG: hypothetical protein JNL73_25150 [Anaerolineales bacterium]|nr:hypothetical protein [Anaerolineales bacterium]